MDAIETQIEIPQAVAFEATIIRWNTKYRNKNWVFVDEKARTTTRISKKSIVAGYYPTLSLQAGLQLHRTRSQMPWGAKPSDGGILVTLL
jgi:hypothetical protein